MVTDFDCWHPDHDEVDVPTVIKTLKQNASNAQSMIIEIIKTFHSFSPKDDPANDCLDTAIITQPRYQSKKTIQKAVLNEVESLSKISTCEIIEKFDQES